MGGRADGAPRRVLIIEDDVDSADSLRMMLHLCGHSVEVAHSGPEGIEMARTFLPDVVLCDLGLPDMDGLEVAEVMRADAALSTARLVALTGYGRPEDIARALGAGFNAHIAKPADPDQIIRLLRA